MRSAKRYTNATFTKRVDHEAGAHRTTRSPGEPRVCRDCGAVYARRRWIAGGTVTARGLAEGARPALCPACDMKRKGLARGYLTIKGDFFTAHRPEIEALVAAEEARAAADNPTGRIIGRERGRSGVLTLVLSTEHLAQRLGHALEKAYGGTVDYGFSHENKLARATWQRD